MQRQSIIVWNYSHMSSTNLGTGMKQMLKANQADVREKFWKQMIDNDSM